MDGKYHSLKLVLQCWRICFTSHLHSLQYLSHFKLYWNLNCSSDHIVMLTICRNQFPSPIFIVVISFIVWFHIQTIYLPVIHWFSFLSNMSICVSIYFQIHNHELDNETIKNTLTALNNWFVWVITSVEIFPHVHYVIWINSKQLSTL